MEPTDSLTISELGGNLAAEAVGPSDTLTGASGKVTAPPEINRTKRAAWSYGSNVIFAVVTMTVGLVSTPILIRLLGNIRFGAVRTATDVIGYVSILELGLSGATLAMLAQAIGRHDFKRVRLILRAALRAYTQMTLLMVLAAIGLGIFITRLVPVPPHMAGELRWGYFILIIGVAVTPLTVYRLFADAGQRTYVVAILLTVQSVTTTGLSLLAALAGWGLPGQFAAAVVATIPLLLVLKISSIRHIGPAASETALKKDRVLVQTELRSLSWPTFALYVCYRLSLLTDNVLIAFFRGPAAVVPFFVTQRLAGIAQSQLSGFTNATWAGFAHLDARGEGHRIGSVLCELTRIISILGVASIFPIVIFDGYFVSLWVGSSLYGGWCLAIVAGLVSFILPIVALWTWVLTGSGRLREAVPMSIVSTVLNVGLSICATKWIGLAGPLIGTLGAMILINIWWLPLLLRRHFGVSPLVLCRSLLEPLLLGVPIALGWVFIARRVSPHGWVSLGIEMLLASVTYLLPCWWLLLGPRDRAQLLARLRLVR